MTLEVALFHRCSYYGDGDDYNDVMQGWMNSWGYANKIECTMMMVINWIVKMEMF